MKKTFSWKITLSVLGNTSSVTITVSLQHKLSDSLWHSQTHIKWEYMYHTDWLCHHYWLGHKTHTEWVNLHQTWVSHLDRLRHHYWWTTQSKWASEFTESRELLYICVTQGVEKDNVLSHQNNKKDKVKKHKKKVATVKEKIRRSSAQTSQNNNSFCHMQVVEQNSHLAPTVLSALQNDTSYTCMSLMSSWQTFSAQN